MWRLTRFMVFLFQTVKWLSSRNILSFYRHDGPMNAKERTFGVAFLASLEKILNTCTLNIRPYRNLFSLVMPPSLISLLVPVMYQNRSRSDCSEIFCAIPGFPRFNLYQDRSLFGIRCKIASMTNAWQSSQQWCTCMQISWKTFPLKSKHCNVSIEAV